MSSSSSQSGGQQAVITINGEVFEHRKYLQLDDMKWDESTILAHPSMLVATLKAFASTPDVDKLHHNLLIAFPQLQQRFAHVVVTEGNEKVVELYFKKGLLHAPSPIEPAVMLKDKHMMWFKYGVIHNAHGPAVIGLEHDGQCPEFALEGHYYCAMAWWKMKRNIRLQERKRCIDVIKSSVLRSTSACKDDQLEFLNNL
jgi:hypothetical protein